MNEHLQDLKIGGRAKTKNELEIERLNNIINKAIEIYENCCKTQDFSTCDLDMYEILKRK